MSDSDVSRSLSPATGGSSSPSPSPPELQQLKAALSVKSGKAVFEHCLGLSKLQGVSHLVDSMIVVCLDTESWIHDHSKITEIGVSTFDSRDMRVVEDPGLHGENLLKQVYFYHARIQENAHLLNDKFCPGNPDTNRFGQTRFVTKQQACAMLTEIFAWPVNEGKPELGFCPVVLMGHALGGDISTLSNTLGSNATQLGTVVKIIDTQHLSREAGFWHERNPIGLAKLVSRCGFAYRDEHTASNDAAMTLICAVQMVLPTHLKIQAAGGRSLQDVVDHIEEASQEQAWIWGTDKYCIRCGGYGHTKSNFRDRHCYVKVHCAHCASSRRETRQKAARFHRTECCFKGPEAPTKLVHSVEAYDLGGN